MTISIGIHNSIHHDITNYMSSHPWDGELIEQVQPEMGAFNEQSSEKGGFGVGFLYEDPFAVNTVEEMERNIRQIQNNLQIRQNIAFQAGKCLRSLAIGIEGMISKTGCKIAQIVDRTIAAEFVRFIKYQRCDEGEKSAFCRRVDHIKGLQAADLAQQNIFIAQNRVAEINGRQRSELFNP